MRYIYPQPSPIDEVTVVVTEQGGMRAYLHARAGTVPEKMKAVIDSVHEKGWQSVPFMFRDRPMLEVRGCSDEKKLLKDLHEGGFIEGTARKEKLATDQISFLDKVRKRTLQAAGLFYIVGDVSFINYGWRESHWEDMAAGIAYAMGTQSLIWYGRNDQSDLQVKDMAKQMEKFLRRGSTPLPEHCSLKAMTVDRKQTTLSKIDDLWRHYPSEVFNAVTGLAGYFVARAAYKYKVIPAPKPGMDAHAIREMRAEGWKDMGLGLTTIASTAAGTVIRERKPDPDDPPPKDMLEQAWNWIREKPLRLTGYGLMVSTLFHAHSTYGAWREAKRVGDTLRQGSISSRAIFVATNIVAEILTALSSKGHGDGVTTDDSVKESVYAIAAETIVKQSPANRHFYLQHVANFLEQPTVMAESRETVLQKLQEHVARLEKNPWILHELQQEKPQETPTPLVSTPSVQKENWREKVMHAAPLAAQHSASGNASLAV